MTDASASVSAAPLVADLEPYVSAAVAAVVGGLIALALALLRKLTGIVIQQAFVEQIERAAATEAGKAVAAAADNLANTQINVGSKLVADAANRIMTSATLKSAIDETGMTPDRLAAIVAGEIGKLQAAMTAAPTASQVIPKASPAHR